MFANLVSVSKPWMGHGTQVKPGMTGLEMLQKAGLDHEIKRHEIATKIGGVNTVLKDYRAIVNGTTGRVYQVASNRYRPHQNRDIANFFQEFCDAGHASMDTIGSLKGGAILWALARLDCKDMVVGKDDKQLPYMMLATSHDGTIPTIGKATSIAPICWNTLMAAIREAVRNTFRLKHSTSFDKRAQDEAKRVMGIAIEQLQETVDLANQLSRVSLDEKGRIEYVTRLLGGATLLEQVVEDTQPQGSVLDQVLDATAAVQVDAKDALKRTGKKILDAIVNSPGSDLKARKDTLWGAVNGVTYVTDHVLSTNENRLAHAWFGSNARLKADAITVAKEMAGIR